MMAQLARDVRLNASRAFLDRCRWMRLRQAKPHVSLFDNSLSIKHTIEPRKHELSAEVRFNRTRDEDNTLLWREPQVLRHASPRALRHRARSTGRKRLAASLPPRWITRGRSPQRPSSRAATRNSRWLDRDYLVQKDLGTGNWIRSDLSNSFSFDEQVHAAYGVVSESVGKFDLQAGLRRVRQSELCARRRRAFLTATRVCFEWRDLVQGERCYPDEGELLPSYSPARNAGAESIPGVLRPAERLHWQPQAQPRVHRCGRA